MYLWIALYQMDGKTFPKTCQQLLTHPLIPYPFPRKGIIQKTFKQKW